MTQVTPNVFQILLDKVSFIPGQIHHYNVCQCATLPINVTLFNKQICSRLGHLVAQKVCYNNVQYFDGFVLVLVSFSF